MNDLSTLEDRIEKPGYLLFIVTVLLLLIIGFVNVLSHEGQGSTVLGLYSIRQTVTILFFLGVIVGWALLLRWPNNDRWLHRLLDWITDRPLAGLALFAGYGVAIWHMMTHPRWLFFPVLQTTILLGMLIFGGMVLFYRWNSPTKPRLWRRLIAGAVGAVIAAEVVVQLLAAGSLLPSLNTPRDTFAPYDRIYYQSAEGTTNSVANRYGYYAPDYAVQENSRHIVLLGDRFLQALAVDTEQKIGVQLEELIVQESTADRESEVFSLGHPDYGPGVYLNTALFELLAEEFEPDEIVVFFDFGNDFQTLNASDGRDIYFIPQNGTADEALGLSDDDFLMRHDYLHEALWGVEGFQPRRFLRSHFLTLRLAREMLQANEVLASAEAAADKRVPAPQDDVALPNSFVFYEESNDEALFIATSHLQSFYEYTREAGIDLRLVTIPVFPDNFFQRENGQAWSTQFGAADLLLPERELRAFAEERNIPFLAMGEYMRSVEVSAGHIQALYLAEDRGQFSPAGHQFFATATYRCFYEQSVRSSEGCDWRD